MRRSALRRRYIAATSPLRRRYVAVHDGRAGIDERLEKRRLLGVVPGEHELGRAEVGDDRHSNAASLEDRCVAGGDEADAGARRDGLVGLVDIVDDARDVDFGSAAL